jgi:prepilin-type N-terminal cleavage/methylation domain-containing protein
MNRLPHNPFLRSRRLLLFETARPQRSGFTLPELLVVITVIGILLAMLYSAIKTATRYSRETITRAELVNIESAWRQYYAHYRAWPSNDVENAGGDPLKYSAANGDLLYEIGPRLARMLAGGALTNGGFLLNPDGVVFLDFSRYESSPSDPSKAAPVSAWGSLRGRRYCVMLDANGDNALAVPVDAASTVHTNIFRPAAAWTVHPDKPGQIIGSWQQ